MSINKKYYFLKLKEDFFREETIVLLEDMKDGFLYSNILLKMYLLSLKHEGQLILSQGIAYTPQMIATLTHHQVGTVERALQIFGQLRLVEERTDGIFFMPCIPLLLGQATSEAQRKQKERAKSKENSHLASGEGGQMSANCPQMSEKCPENVHQIIEYRDKSIERESKREKNAPAHFYGKYQNVSLSTGDLQQLQKELPTQYENYIERLSEYMASSGKSYKGHLATIMKWARKDTTEQLEAHQRANLVPLRTYKHQGDESL